MRRVFSDAMVSAATLLALVTLLVAATSAVGTQMRDLASVIIDVVNDAVTLHTTFALFVVVATVLTVFMVRT